LTLVPEGAASPEMNPTQKAIHPERRSVKEQILINLSWARGAFISLA